MRLLSMFVARVELVKLSDVPKKAYNSRSSEFGGFLACSCIHPLRHPSYSGLFPCVQTFVKCRCQQSDSNIRAHVKPRMRIRVPNIRGL